MAEKIKCKECGERLEDDFDFCPYCGEEANNEKYGFLGKNDSFNKNKISKNLGNKSLFEEALGGAVKMLSKELNIGRIASGFMMPNSKMELYVNGRKVNMSNEQDYAKTTKINSEIDKEIIEKSRSLPRKEATGQVKRSLNKVFYEINVPGINSPRNVIVTRLENSIEVKVYTEKAVYKKNINIKMPLLGYSINKEEGKLILEFKA
jgi:RNA polymerase subunit RPABC4/transcription elongation factor Spt4